MSDYVTYEFPVLEADTLGQEATLEIWASPEESEYVEFSLTYSGGAESVGFEPDVAVQLADALDQRAPVEAPASTTTTTATPSCRSRGTTRAPTCCWCSRTGRCGWSSTTTSSRSTSRRPCASAPTNSWPRPAETGRPRVLNDI